MYTDAKGFEVREDVRQMIGKVPTLSAEERAQLRAALSAASTLGDSAKTSARGDSDSDLAIEVLAATMRKLGVENTSPAMLKKAQQYASFKSKVDDVSRFMSEAGCKTRLEKSALLSLAFELLYQEHVKRNIATSSRVIMREVHRVSSVLDAHFPGYARAGMLAWIVNRKENR